METLILKNKKTGKVFTETFDDVVTVIDAIKFLSHYGIKMSRLKLTFKRYGVTKWENEECFMLLI